MSNENNMMNAIEGVVSMGTKGAKIKIALIAAAVVVVVVLLALLLFNPFGWKFSLKFWDNQVKIEETANIVEKVRKISEFTTACYYEEYVLKGERVDRTESDGWFGKSVDTVENEIILTVKGTVRAGFDLSKLKQEDFRLSGDTLNIVLPSPEIFDIISNPSDYKIFEENGKWNHEEIVALQSKGKKRLLYNAITGGLLERANNTGKERIVDLFKAFGYSEVNVVTSEVVLPVYQVETPADATETEEEPSEAA